MAVGNKRVPDDANYSECSEDTNAEPDSTTDNSKHTKRYGESLQQKQGNHQAKFVDCYINGEPFKKPIRIPFTLKLYGTCERLLDDLNERYKHPPAFHYIFLWPSGKLVANTKEIAEAPENNTIVVSRRSRLVTYIPYGNVEYEGRYGSVSDKYSSQSDYLEGRGSQREKPLPKKRFTELSPRRSQNGLQGGESLAPQVIYVINNIDRKMKERLIINPNTGESFEDILKAAGSVLKLKPPTRGLYSSKSPYKKVESFSTLSSERRKTDTFIVCGMEGPPKELEKLNNYYNAKGRRMNGEDLRRSKGDRSQITENYEEILAEENDGRITQRSPGFTEASENEKMKVIRRNKEYDQETTVDGKDDKPRRGHDNNMNQYSIEDENTNENKECQNTAMSRQYTGLNPEEIANIQWPRGNLDEDVDY
ncbi:hypothetical protein CHS0354_040027 [Potamilus streckersoni]|uniref:Doublecortin domain-containing protein n=1 Tax=Potamilus streckersoni TaxID=2493646 RepID=A0AAE0ST93_9BIVA|nr:hypothetical protein CHS0354_040027 [Potamilus streckersoni]